MGNDVKDLQLRPEKLLLVKVDNTALATPKVQCS